MGGVEEGPSPPEQTEEELEARHAQEETELEEKASAHLELAKAGGSKSKKAKAAIEAAEREIEQWKYDLREQQEDEMSALQARLAGANSANASTEAPATEEAESAAPSAADVEETEKEQIQRKKEKAQKKKQNRAAKEAELEAEKEREKLAAGPSKRLLESAALAARLSKCKPPLRVLDVAADGNCLYRAIADQLRRVRPDLHEWKRPSECAHEEIRALCAASLRSRSDDYSPFAELADGEDFAGYCDRVEKSGDWGGELELKALADALKTVILVHRAEENAPLKLGEVKYGGAALQVSYHRHYYTLGEHYNSVVPCDADK